MKVEVTITADDVELEEVNELIAGLADGSGLEATVEDEEVTEELELTENERYVLASLQEEPRSALRVVHRVATEIEGAPFDSFDEDDGWNEERREVREVLWSMKSDGLVDNDGQLWYPTDEAPTNVLD